MNISPKDIDFSKAKILIVGDAMLDEYWHGDTTRVSPEAPVPIVAVTTKENRLGGAANVAFNIIKLNPAKVGLCYVKAQDSAGITISSKLQENNIEDINVINASHSTTTKLRILGNKQQLLRIDHEETKIEPTIIDLLLEKYNQCIDDYDVVVLSDYNKGVLKNPTPFIQLATKKNIPVIVDPKKNDFKPYANANIITPNLKEFEEVVGKCDNQEEIIQKGKQLLSQYNFKALIVTQGKDGLTLIQKDKAAFNLSATSKNVFDVTGAGDTIIALLALGLSNKLKLETSCYIANFAAGLVVSKVGTSNLTPFELNDIVANNKLTTNSSLKELASHIRKLQLNGKRIVLVNGCFDILHIGHIRFFNKAKEHGDKLIVAINDDNSIARLKGKNRPINKLSHRVEMLNNLTAVDWVVPFSENTPANVTEMLKPNIIIKNALNYENVSQIPVSECSEHGKSDSCEIILLCGKDLETEGISSTKILNTSLKES